MRNAVLASLVLLSCILQPFGCNGSNDAVSPAAPSGTQDPTAISPCFLFIHHSVGDGFLHDGGMWGMLEGLGYEVHDRTYGDGWIGENTDPEHFPITFTERFHDMVTWELGDGQQYDVVAFKSCFPASQICSEDMLAEYQSYYNTIKSVTRQHRDILFIPFTTPPLVPADTEPHCAARARRFAEWLTGSYDNGESNLIAYDLFDVLAGDDPGAGDFNCLRFEYQSDPHDSHPNTRANQVVATHFTEWLARNRTN